MADGYGKNVGRSWPAQQHHHLAWRAPWWGHRRKKSAEQTGCPKTLGLWLLFPTPSRRERQFIYINTLPVNAKPRDRNILGFNSSPDNNSVLLIPDQNVKKPEETLRFIISWNINLFIVYKQLKKKKIPIMCNFTVCFSLFTPLILILFQFKAAKRWILSFHYWPGPRVIMDNTGSW